MQMTESPVILSFTIPEAIKNTLRLRAAKRKTSISEVAREIFMQAVQEPSAEELLFLGSSVQENERIDQGAK
jgi:plasmid stability protein